MEELKLMRRAELDLENQDDRRVLLRILYPLIENWNGEIPDLRRMFKSKEINWLLMEDVSCGNKKASFVDFAIKAGYKDEPEWPSLMRTTAIHLVASQTSPDMALIRKLFHIYGRYDYVDEKTGLTHLHVACMSAELTYFAAMFLGQGRSNPNCRVRETGDTPLHYAARHLNYEAVYLLLRHGAEPTLANDDGLIPLQLLYEVDKKTLLPYLDRWNIGGSMLLYMALRLGNKRAAKLMLAKGADPLLCNDEDLKSLRMAVSLRDRTFAQMFYEICDEQDRIDDLNLVNKIKNININYNNNNNNEKEDILPKTDKENRKRLESLYEAIVSHDMILVDRLVKEGANPNARDFLGRTPLHVICQADSSLIGESLARLFFETCDEVKQQLEINAEDKNGLTPLQWAVARLLPETVELLLERGADLAKFAFPPRDAFLRDEVYSGDLEAMTEIAACAADICDSLERRGYKMKDPEVVFLMERLEEYGLFAEAVSRQLDESEEYRSHEARLRRLFWPCVLQPYMKKKNYRVPIDRTCGELEATRCADLWNIFREAQ